MAIEINRGPVLSRFLNRIVGDPYGTATYTVPDELNTTLRYNDGHHYPHMPVSLYGPKDNLQVLGEYGNGFSFNELAPANTMFGISVFADMVQVNVERHEVIIPARERYRDALVFGLFHAIGRLHVHEDAQWHEKSGQVHHLLNGAIAHLQACGKVELPRSLMERKKEIEAWKIVCEEERQVSVRALELIAELLEKGFNPIVHIETVPQLVEMVNSNHLLRTLRQDEINPRRTGEQIGIPMTLSTEEIRAILQF